jgi:hypothetical protein
MISVIAPTVAPDTELLRLVARVARPAMTYIPTESQTFDETAAIE